MSDDTKTSRRRRRNRMALRKYEIFSHASSGVATTKTTAACQTRHGTTLLLIDLQYHQNIPTASDMTSHSNHLFGVFSRYICSTGNTNTYDDSSELKSQIGRNTGSRGEPKNTRIHPNIF